MKKYVVFIETTHTQYYRFTELTSTTESEEELKAEAIARACAFIRALNYDPYSSYAERIELYRITIFMQYVKTGNLIVYRSICEQPPKSKEFRPNLDKTIYYISNNFVYFKTYLYFDGDTPCHNEPTLSK